MGNKKLRESRISKKQQSSGGYEISLYTCMKISRNKFKDIKVKNIEKKAMQCLVHFKNDGKKFRYI